MQKGWILEFRLRWKACLDGGPSAIGKLVKTSRIMASTNAAALDLTACKITGYGPEDISTLIRARDRGFIRNFKEVELLGHLENFKFIRVIKGKIS